MRVSTPRLSEACCRGAPAPQIERIRTLSDCAQQLNSAHDKDAGRYLAQVGVAPPGIIRRAPAASSGRAQRAADGRTQPQRWLPLLPAATAQKMAEELFALPLEEALPILRAYGHYLK